MSAYESQNKIILAELNEGVRITQRDALILCGSSRLAARVHDLKEKGAKIVKETITVNAFGRKSRVAQYFIKDTKKSCA